MTKLPLITIVTPSFNQGHFLEATIQSVLRQDYPHIEYIIIDGGSTDGSVAIIKKYEKHVAYWISEPDSGQSNAINKGFAKATGEILAWLNSDDVLMPSAVGIAAHYLTRHSANGVVYGDRLHIDAKGNIIGINQCPSHNTSMFKRKYTLPQETVFFRKEVFEKVGGLDESLHFAMDFDLWCKMSKVTKMMHIPFFLGCFREHETAKSVAVHNLNGQVTGRYLQEHQAVYRKHFSSSLPSPIMMKWYRLLRHLNLIREQRSKTYRDEIRIVNSLISKTFK